MVRLRDPWTKIWEKTHLAVFHLETLKQNLPGLLLHPILSLQPQCEAWRKLTREHFLQNHFPITISYKRIYNDPCRGFPINRSNWRSAILKLNNTSTFSILFNDVASAFSAVFSAVPTLEPKFEKRHTWPTCSLWRRWSRTSLVCSCIRFFHFHLNVKHGGSLHAKILQNYFPITFPYKRIYKDLCSDFPIHHLNSNLDASKVATAKRPQYLVLLHLGWQPASGWP